MMFSSRSRENMNRIGTQASWVSDQRFGWKIPSTLLLWIKRKKATHGEWSLFRRSKDWEWRELGLPSVAAAMIQFDHWRRRDSILASEKVKNRKEKKRLRLEAVRLYAKMRREAKQKRKLVEYLRFQKRQNRVRKREAEAQAVKSRIADRRLRLRTKRSSTQMLVKPWKGKR